MVGKIISGGQSGADQAGWRSARAFGIPTGGAMLSGFLTERPDGRGDEGHPELAQLYGAVEMPTADYKARTVQNVRDSDGTIWFGDYHTHGGRATLDACRLQGKPFLIVYRGVTRPDQVRDWIVAKGIRTLNVAGNRESKSPGIGDRVERFLGQVFRRLGMRPVG